jgi:acyl carrier protein
MPSGGLAAPGAWWYPSARREMDPDVRQKLKELMVAELNLDGRSPEDIDDAAPLFGEGLGLDSLDALELAMIVEEHFGVKIPEGPEARPIFASVNAIVEHVTRARAAG